jgi:peptide/nickel transport system substrate-binding protein
LEELLNGNHQEEARQRDASRCPRVAGILRKGEISRREFLRLCHPVGRPVSAASALAACAPAATPTAAPPPTAVPPTQAPQATKAPEATKAPAPTAAPTQAPAAAGPKRGGTMTIASRVQRIDHPARLSWIEGVNQFREVCEYLTYTGADNVTIPWLLESWKASDDLKTWTLNVRKGIKFNNGQPFTADDVVFNFKQWLDKAVGSSMLGLIGYLKATGVEKVDDYTVKLNLDSAQIGVPEHLFHYPAMIVPKTFEGDITKQPIGTGPFLLDKYVPTERAEFKARTDYWKNGADGKPLPYLDRLVYLDLGQDAAARIAAMRSGQVDDVFNPSPEIWQAVKDLPGVKVYTTTTGQTWVIRMRADVKPWSDPKVRQALKMCQDRQKLLDLAYFGEGSLGHDTHIAPVHPEYCKKDIPKYDPAGAKNLLAEAGFPNGLEVEMTAMEARAEPAIAQALGKQRQAASRSTPRSCRCAVLG